MNQLLVGQPNLTYVGANVLTLPASHTDDELELARRLAETLSCEELHVFWTAEEPAAAA